MPAEYTEGRPRPFPFPLQRHPLAGEEDSWLACPRHLVSLSEKQLQGQGWRAHRGPSAKWSIPTGYRDAEIFLLQDEIGGGASARNSVPVDPRPCVPGTGSRVGARAARGGDLESQLPAPCRFLPSSLSPCPGPGSGLPAAASPLRSCAASSPPPLGPAPGPRLRLRVTILTPAMLGSARVLHTTHPGGPRGPSRDSTLAPPFLPRGPGTTTPSKLGGGAQPLFTAGSAGRASGGGRGVAAPDGPGRGGRSVG